MGVKERKKMEKQMRRSQILDAARHLLFSEGIDHISISRISKASQLGVGTIYFYYKSKEDIFIALQEEGLDVLFSIIHQIHIQKKMAPDRKLIQIADAYYAFTRDHQAYFNIINYFLSSPKIFFNEAQKQHVDMAGSRILQVIQEIIHQGNASGCFAKADPKKFSIMFWGTLHGLIQFKKLEHTTLQNENIRQVYDYSVNKLVEIIQKKGE